jgi:hypothetical protein
VFALLSAMGEQPQGAICVRQATLAEKLHVSVGTIGRALKELVAKGVLTLATTRAVGRCNVYDRGGVSDRGNQVAALQAAHGSAHGDSNKWDDQGRGSGADKATATAVATETGNAIDSSSASDGSVASCAGAASKALSAAIFPVELIAQIKKARACFRQPSEKAKAILDVIAQFLPASIIDEDNLYPCFMVPAKMETLVPTQIPPQSKSEPRPEETAIANSAANSSRMPSMLRVPDLSSPGSSISLEHAETRVSTRAETRTETRVDARSDVLAKEDMLVKIEALQRQYDDCMAAEAEGFIMAAFQIRLQMSALQNKLAQKGFT